MTRPKKSKSAQSTQASITLQSRLRKHLCHYFKILVFCPWTYRFLHYNTNISQTKKKFKEQKLLNVVDVFLLNKTIITGLLNSHDPAVEGLPVMLLVTW